MKKKLYKSLVLVAIALFGFFAASCGDKKPGPNPDPGKTPSKQITLTYASWGDQVLEQQMLDAFMKAHPNIKVILDASINAGNASGTAFTQNLVAASQANMLPDVFVTDNVPTVISNGLVYDISEFWDKDADAAKVFDNIASTAVYYDKALKKNVRLAAPSYQFLKGFLVNTKLINDLGLNVPEYDWTFEEFKDLCLQIQNVGVYDSYPVHAVNGYYGALDFEKAMTAQAGVGLGYDSWDGTKFDYNNEAWIKYRQETELFYDTKLLEQLTEEEKKEIYGVENAFPFEKGHVAFGVEGSWNVITTLDNYKAAGFDVEFYPYPAGVEAHQAVILDFMCVSSQTDYPAEAFELLKWMSFGKDGWAKRLQLMKETKTGLDRFPVADYPEIWEEITNYMTDLKDNQGKNYGAYIYCIEHLNEGAPDCDKWLPGYSSFWNYVAETNETEGWYDKDTDQLAREWSAKLNDMVKEEYEKLGLEPAK